MRANGALVCLSGFVRIDPLLWHAERTSEADGAGGSNAVPGQEFKSGNHVNPSLRPTCLAAVANVHVGRSNRLTRFGPRNRRPPLTRVVAGVFSCAGAGDWASWPHLGYSDARELQTHVIGPHTESVSINDP